MVKIDKKEFANLEPLINRLMIKKQVLDTKRPIPHSILAKLKAQLSIEWTYNSNSIEGNTLNENETQLVLQEGITIKGKSLREHFEVFNHDKALNHLYSLVSSDYVLTSSDILSIHSYVLRSIEDNIAGRYRNGTVRIVGANFVPPNAHKVYDLMEELISFVNQNPYDLNDIELASIFHHQFVHIHPFFDGNGRTVRLVMNLLLLRRGFPPAIILKNDKKKYFDALNQANLGKYSKLILLMNQAVDRSLTFYLNAFDADLDNEYLPISSIVEDEMVPYGQEYVSLLARQGKIDAYKEGRIWYTSKKSILEYIHEQ
jgi:Fic family protein